MRVCNMIAYHFVLYVNFPLSARCFFGLIRLACISEKRVYIYAYVRITIRVCAFKHTRICVYTCAYVHIVQGFH